MKKYVLTVETDERKETLFDDVILGSSKSIDKMLFVVMNIKNGLFKGRISMELLDTSDQKIKSRKKKQK